MRRTVRLLVTLAVLSTVLGAAPAPGRGSCDDFEYDDKCEARSLLVRSRVGIRVLPFLVPASDTLLAVGTDYVEEESSGDIVLKAFDASTGRRRWSRSYGGPRSEALTAGALGRKGRTLFVAGTKMRAGRTDWIVAAFSVRTGRVLWERTYGGGGHDAPGQILFDGRNDAIYVAGGVSRRRPTAAVVAYDSSSGRRLWVRERRPYRREWIVLGVDLRARDLYVLERSSCRTSGCRKDGLTLTRAMPTRSGFHLEWSGPLSERDGSIVFGPSPLEATAGGVIVGGVQYDEATYEVSFFERAWGRRRWTANPDPAGEPSVTYPILAADPRRRQVVVADASLGTPSKVRAIGLPDGRFQWERPFPGGDFPGTVYDVAVGRAGVYLAGMAEGRNETISPTTVHLGPEGGRRRWVARYAAGHGWEEGVGSYLRAGRHGVTVVLGTPTNDLGGFRDDWVGYATYLNRE